MDFKLAETLARTSQNFKTQKPGGKNGQFKFSTVNSY